MKQKKKIAVLGGGMGSLSAVFELTNYAGWEDDYEITIYQMGWRLGGKLAIGRGPNNRIEEHGIHVFLGFYNNAFRVMQDVYKERKAKGLAPHNPFQDWTDAFNKQSSIMLPQYSTALGNWTNYTIKFPENDLVPGIGPPPDHMQHIISLIDKIFKLEEEFDKLRYGCLGSLLKGIMSIFVKDHTIQAYPPKKLTGSKKPDFNHLHKVRKHLNRIKGNRDNGSDTDIAMIEEMLQSLDNFLIDLQQALKDLHKQDGDIYDFVIWAQLGVINLKGIFKDKVFDYKTNSFNFKVINHIDYRDWLTNNGASEEVIYCAPVRDIYTLVFAYKNGDTSVSGSIAAGTALRGAMLIVMGYKGAVMYKFSSGTADVVVSPVYQVLQSRGVKFQFFQKVKKIYHGNNGVIEKISMERQMAVSKGPENYNPFLEVHNIQSWPSQPDFEQIEKSQADLYHSMHNNGKNVNLESNWTAWKGEDYELSLDKDFDQVICGIPIAALSDICSEVIENNLPWKNMMKYVATVQTQAVQLWFKPTLKELGMDVTKWGMEEGDEPITDTYTNPINSWIDFSNLIKLENWPEDNKPGFLVYYCGNLLDDDHIPSMEASNFPKTQYKRVYDMAIQWLSNNAGYFWPNGVNPENEQGVDFRLLVNPHKKSDDKEEITGMKKLEHQFFRANIDPTERYTLSLPESEAFRLKTDATGYDNFFITGDWIDCDLNMGCVEATVISGLMCAAAVRTRYGLETKPIMIDL